MFLPKLLPGKHLTPNGPEKRVPANVAADKRQMRSDVALGLLEFRDVVDLSQPFEYAHVYMELRWHRRVRGRSVYLPEDPNNAAYALKPAVDGLVDARLLPDDSYRHVAVMSAAVRRVDSFEEEGLGIVITEWEED